MFVWRNVLKLKSRLFEHVDLWLVEWHLTSSLQFLPQDVQTATMTSTVLGCLRLFPATLKRLSILSKILNGAGLKEGLIENGYIWVINFLINFSLALIDSGSCAISGVRTQEKERLASVKRGFKITMLYLTKQHIIVKTGHCLSRQTVETLLTLASSWFRRSCGRL